MSRTLFAYIFKDLFRIFLMASGALAGIMSFGGLLRPLTREGLDAGQVARMLTYFGPAMTTYSFPVAALFATAVVYGRLASDNELTACKAGGISLLSLSVSGPALMLGLIVAITSLLFLCFIVPASTLKVEKVVYSNLARLVQSRIERTHEIDMQQMTIFAQEAHVLAPDANTPPGQQRVELIGPEIVSVDRDPNDHTLRIPKEFYTASRAYVYIDPQNDGEEVNVKVNLIDGFKFPRRYEGATEAGIESTSYGPISIPSPIKEDVKFMNVWKLKELYADLSKSRRLSVIIDDFVRNGQRLSLLLDVTNDMNGPQHGHTFVTDSGGQYVVSIPDGKGYTALFNEEVHSPYVEPAATQASAPAPQTRPVERVITFRHPREDGTTLVIKAANVSIKAHPQSDNASIEVRMELHDCMQTLETPDGKSDEEQPRPEYKQVFSVPMSAAAKAMAGRNIAFYEDKKNAVLGDQHRLTREKVTVINSIIAESNGRASFAISCLILVMAGSALGMMFRSGNFLTAFAVSFVPALLSITLIIAGQRTAGNLPQHFNGSNNTLGLGLTLIWSGNAVNLLLAIGLLWKLSRR